MAARKKTGRGGARPGSGPKPKPASQRRSEPVMVMLTPSEHAALRRAAGKEAMATYAHRVLAKHLARNVGRNDYWPMSTACKGFVSR